jgi:hypothetical protein
MASQQQRQKHARTTYKLTMEDAMMTKVLARDGCRDGNVCSPDRRAAQEQSVLDIVGTWHARRLCG